MALPPALSNTSTTSTTSTIKTSPTKRAQTPDAAEAVARKKAKTMKMLDELEAQLEARCEDMMAEARRKAHEMKLELKVQLLYLPKSVLAMPWKTFVQDFGGSLDKVIESAKAVGYRSDDPESPRSSRGASLVMRCSTRSFSRDADVVFTVCVQTIQRTARKGEKTYMVSANGSPIIAEPTTAVKAPVHSVVATFEEKTNEPVACWTLDEDVTLDLSNPEHQKQMSDEHKAEAMAKLQALQAKVNMLMQQLSSS
ncbi:TPA: hypothetical protein N0F65_010338 [Lagenidium giganteum]|uniref:Borealin N-terminal domain-containing protein n=1 Tax=Lagenidium giganteum TaxID=4803 RepID=A0AAV2Z4T1_9STRA|nr:TPA: hypothetical protein N0F65_010338 [Lagenidium giganteum]